MKISAKNIECPDCNTSDMVMGMATGNIKIFGCLKCRNAQGAHLKASEAKKAFLNYINKKKTKTKTVVSE
jgi:hypothetical protein